MSPRQTLPLTRPFRGTRRPRRSAVAGSLAVLAGLLAAALTAVLTALAPAGADAAVRPPVTQRPGAPLAGVPTLLAASLPAQPVVLGDERPSAFLRKLRESQLGARSGIVASFAPWRAGESFPAAHAAMVRSGGAVPMLAWAPSDVTLAQIAAGDQDAYIAQWAQDAAAYGHPVLLRLFPELNCRWSPWAAGVGGNTADDFVAAWHHVVAAFRTAGAGNVRFIWNVGYSCDTDLLPVWPGASWVDYTGIDVYNWGDPTADLADAHLLPMLDIVRTLGPNVPVMLPEVGANRAHGSQGPWLRELLRVSAAEGIRALVYFDEDRSATAHPDWRLGSDDPFVPRLRAVARDVREAVHLPQVVTAGRYSRAAIEALLMAQPTDNRIGSRW
ncbi:MAG: glycoside hydrolase family 26 protein [Frankiaceae bacterium]